ncbi:hypothetical protein D9M69_427550 [compost metagenome]
MGTRDQVGIAYILQRARVGALDADPGQRLADVTRTPGTSGTGVGQAIDQLGTERVDLQADDMHGLPGPRHRDLHARHVAHAEFLGRGARRGLPADLVVVGQRPVCNACIAREFRHRAGRQRAVGHGGMAVQVGVDGMGVLHGAHSTPVALCLRGAGGVPEVVWRPWQSPAGNAGVAGKRAGAGYSRALHHLPRTVRARLAHHVYRRHHRHHRDHARRHYH